MKSLESHHEGSYADIRKALSIVSDMERGFQIRCCDQSCRASVTTALVHLKRRITWETEVISQEPNQWFMRKEYRIPKTNPRNIKVNEIGNPTKIAKSITPTRIKPKIAGSINSAIIAYFPLLAIHLF